MPEMPTWAIVLIAILSAAGGAGGALAFLTGLFNFFPNALGARAENKRKEAAAKLALELQKRQQEEEEDKNDRDNWKDIIKELRQQIADSKTDYVRIREIMAQDELRSREIMQGLNLRIGALEKSDAQKGEQIEGLEAANMQLEQERDGLKDQIKVLLRVVRRLLKQLRALDIPPDVDASDMEEIGGE